MPKFLIEVEHSEDKASCMRAVKTFLETGSHFMTNADWGCSDNEHKAWLVVDMDTKEKALDIVPPRYRDRAKVVKLENFTLEDIQHLESHHA